MQRRIWMAVCCLAAGFLLNSWSMGTARELSARASAGQNFVELCDLYLDNLFALWPTWGTGVGLHKYDGKLGDYSRAGIEAKVESLKSFKQRFDKIDTDKLTGSQSIDYSLVLSDINSRLNQLEEIKMWEKNPNMYSSHASAAIFSLIKREYAPLPVRLQSVIERERKIPELLDDARKNLKNPPRIYTEIALEQMPAIIGFFESSVPDAFAGVKDKRLMAEFKTVNARAVSALKDYRKFLKEDLLKRSQGEYAIGAELFARKLLFDEMVAEPLPEVLKKGYRELRRLQAEFKKTAGQIDSNRPASKVLSEMSADHPAPGDLIRSTQDGLEGIRRFCIEKQIVTIPSEERVKVAETPPFHRAISFASMDTPGPFEKKSKKAFYYVTLPEPAWPAKKVEEHMSFFSRPSVLNTSVHEAYPGHYVQFLWVPKAPSRVRKVLGCSSNSEGWAHYCEEMMVKQGFGNGDKNLKLAQLRDALLRACRYIVGIKMHTQNMSFDEAVDFFMTEGYLERVNAEREAKRGTMDPTYLVYTLGKLKIKELREDYKSKKGDDFKLKEFHDSFLREGFPPIKLVRKALLN